MNDKSAIIILTDTLAIMTERATIAEAELKESRETATFFHQRWKELEVERDQLKALVDEHKDYFDGIVSTEEARARLLAAADVPANPLALGGIIGQDIGLHCPPTGEGDPEQ